MLTIQISKKTFSLSTILKNAESIINTSAIKYGFIVYSFFPLKTVSLVMLAPLLFTSLRVVAARLLTMANHHAISLFVVESI